MSRLLIFALLAAAGYFAYSRMTADEVDPSAKAKIDSSASDSEVDGSDLEGGAEEKLSAGNDTKRASQRGNAMSALTDAALAEWVATGTLGDLESQVRELVSSGKSEVASDLLALAGSEPGARWTALTRLYEGSPPERRTQLRDTLVESARDGAASAGRSFVYEVVSGDSLSRICSKLKRDHDIRITPGMLRWVNRIKGDRIFPKQKLRVPKDPLRIEVSTEEYWLRAYLGEGLIREYGVGLGKEGRTPRATFVIDHPLIKPPWPHPETGKVLHYGEPGYQIGTRWLGFADTEEHNGFGIHGTDQPDSIGKNESLGCVRLRNPDVEELFELVPQGITVTID